MAIAHFLVLRPAVYTDDSEYGCFSHSPSPEFLGQDVSLASLFGQVRMRLDADIIFAGRTPSNRVPRVR